MSYLLCMMVHNLMQCKCFQVHWCGPTKSYTIIISLLFLYVFLLRRHLVLALNKAERADLIDNLCTIVTEQPLFQPNFPEREISVLFSYGTNILKQRYKVNAVATSIQWPPPLTQKIFDLVMLKKDRIQRGTINDEFVRMQVTGKVNVRDVLQNKTPVKLDVIFNGEEHTRRIILIEGAPGSGKSTLSLSICQMWESKSLFMDYDAVILIRLHDPLVQEAKSIADLLPYLGHNPAMRKEVAEEMESTFGEGILWILDGWDELPTSETVAHDSIIHKLMHPDGLLYKSSVIITSRPVGSANLHQLVSSRYEIIGFTLEERKQYFQECLKGEPNPEKALGNLLEQIEENPVVEASCYLPLYASIIVHLYLVGNESLPTTVHGIFTSIVQCILSRHLQEKVLEESLTSVQIDLLGKLPQELHKPVHALYNLAFSGLMQNNVTFSLEDVESAGSANEVLKIGLLQAHTRIGSQGPLTYYCFLHYSIQELLAAVHLCHMPSSEQISMFKKFFSNSRLNTFFQFYAGMTKLTTKRSVVSKIPPKLRLVSADILDVVKKIVKRENAKFRESKPLLVSLLRCLYEAQDAPLCKFIAEQLDGKLDVSHSSLTPVDCLSIGYFLSNVCSSTKSAHSANLSSCSIDDQCCKYLMRGLCRCCTQINTQSASLVLDLTYNNVNENGANHIATALKNYNMLHKLSLGSHVSTGCIIGSLGIYSIACALFTNTSLTELSLSGCSVQVTEENGEAIKKMLENNSSLQVLTLSYNPSLFDSRIQFFAEGLKLNTGLRELNLSNCGLTSIAVKHLSRGLQENNSLKILNISYNNICDDGAAYFETLNSSLEDLNISHCGILDLGIKTLSRALSNNRTLRKFDIRGNQITDEGMSFLTEALVTNPSHGLETLLIPWNLNMSGAVKALKRPR